MKYYAGIGSRETPSDVLALMTEIAFDLDLMGYMLRSGGADGADSAFEAGVVFDAQVFLPWKGFNGRQRGITIQPEFEVEAATIAQKFHPAWDCLTQGAKKLHSRNVCQILGPDLRTPSSFVVCWTKDGKATGGTGQAIRIAEAYQIPVFNLKRDGDLGLLMGYIA